MNRRDGITIDILFPYYGDVEMMKKAVNSILDQTYANWRLLAFDDGYPSKEPEQYFKQIMKKDTKENGLQRIFYEKNKKNLGANGNYRKALTKASSKYYVMMGADDIMHPDFLDNFIKILSKHKNIDIFQPSVNVIDENDNIHYPLVDKIKSLIQPRKSGVYSGDRITSTLMTGAWHYFPSMVWKTSVAKEVGFNTKYDVVQDLCMIVDILERGGNLYFDNSRPTFSYRRHSKSDSSVKAINGFRFNEELSYFKDKSAQFKKLGWKKSSSAAKLHLLSRLNALSNVAEASRNPDGKPAEIIKSALRW